MSELDMTALSNRIQDVRDYLGIEDCDDEVINRNIQRQVLAADKYLQAVICSDYDRSDPRAQELLAMVAAELYDNRGVIGAKANASFRRIAGEFTMQMRLEKRADNEQSI